MEIDSPAPTTTTLNQDIPGGGGRGIRQIQQPLRRSGPGRAVTHVPKSKPNHREYPGNIVKPNHRIVFVEEGHIMHGRVVVVRALPSLHPSDLILS